MALTQGPWFGVLLVEEKEQSVWRGGSDGLLPEQEGQSVWRGGSGGLLMENEGQMEKEEQRRSGHAQTVHQAIAPGR
jgi:hypothetical protein